MSGFMVYSGSTSFHVDVHLLYPVPLACTVRYGGAVKYHEEYPVRMKQKVAYSTEYGRPWVAASRGVWLCCCSKENGGNTQRHHYKLVTAGPLRRDEERIQYYYWLLVYFDLV